MLSVQAILARRVADAFGGGMHGLADIDRAEVQLHGAGVDGGKVEYVIDDGKQRVVEVPM